MPESNIKFEESPEEWNKSQLALLQAAKNEFWKFGVRKVTVEDICLAAGLSKMTFYRHFKNKSEVVEIVIRQLLDDSMGRYHAIIAQPIPFKDKMHQLLMLKQTEVSNVSNAFIQDVYHDDENGMKSLFDEYRSRMMHIIISDFKKAQDEGELRKNLKLKFLEYMLNDINSKMVDPLLLSMYPDQKELIMEVSNFFIYGILNTDE